MTNLLKAVLKYLRYYPDAKLTFIYEIKYNNNKVFTFDKGVVKRYKYIRDAKIKRKLICRTLY